MPTVSVWSNVAIAVQSALSALQVISGITKANPGVATYVGADPANGNYVKVAAVGMSQVNGRVFRVAAVDTVGNTFELEGEDTTAYGTFVSGGLEIITFGTTLATATTVSGSGGDFSMIDTTTIHEDVRSEMPGVANPMTYSFDNIWDTADAGLAALLAASAVKAQRAVRITFANARKVLFCGYIGATLMPGGSAQDKVTTPVVITMYGRPTYYTT